LAGRWRAGTRTDGLGNMKSGGHGAWTVRLDRDLHVVVERNQEAKKALDGELAEFAAEHFGDVRLLDAEERGGLRLFEAAVLEDGVDFVDQLGFDEVLLGFWKTEVFEDVAAAHFVSLPLHDSLSLAISSASRILRLIIAMSR
jgi:hypothetical protein